MNDQSIEQGMKEPNRILIPTDKLPAFIQKAYALSQPQGMGHLHYTPGPLTDAEINHLMTRDKSRGSIGLDYVNGRAVKLLIGKMGDQFSVIHFDKNKWYDHTDEQFLELLKVLDPTDSTEHDQAKGLTAPRITQADVEADVEAEIAGEYYASGAGAFSNNTLPNAHYSTLNLLTFCVLVLRNGHKVVGINHGPIDPANFDAAHGRKDARDKAIEQIWPLLGFRLRDELSRPVLTEADAIADLNGTPRPA